MKDPTYDLERIEKDPVWGMAYILSECYNDKAPIGWSNYIWVARLLNEKYGKPERPTALQSKP